MYKILKENLFRFESFAVILMLLLFLFRNIIPLFLIPFIPLYFIIIIYLILFYKNRFKQVMVEYLHNYFLLLSLLLIILLSLLLSNKIYLVILKDTLNSIILFSVFYLASIVVSTKNDLKVFFETIIVLIIFFAVIISINGFSELLYIFKKTEDFSISNTDTLSNSYLELDTNFGILPVIFGMLSLFHLLLNTDSIGKKVFYNLLLVLFAIFILFTGSRRGVTILFGIITLCIILQIFRIISKNKILKKLASISVFFIISTISSGLLIFFSPYYYKNKALEIIGSQNPVLAKENITIILYKYTTTFTDKKTYLDVFYKFWNVVPDDPESGWGIRKHKTIYPLSGKNVEIVPADSKGYLLDNTSNSNSWGGNTYSYTLIGHKDVEDSDIVKTSVYCYVSDEFNGDWVRLSTEGATYGRVENYYNLNSKGTWQKLELAPKCSKGNVRIFLYFSKYRVTDFTTLTGNVIFAYPQVEVIHKDSLTTFLEDNKNKFNKSKVELKDNLFIKNKNSPAYSKAGINSFAVPLLNVITRTDLLDILRRWTSNLLSEDSTYHSYRNILLSDKISEEFQGSRIMRWQFAREIFTKEYNWRQKLFGGGFNHINWYGYYFLKDKTKSDWPHNPFLSVLLYSGILGLMLYLFLLYKVFYYYIKYIREYLLFFIFFLITFFFAFFSGGSPFDPQIMGFFVILPFFIHSVHKKDAGSNGKPQLKNE
jgi:hypothetical protein